MHHETATEELFPREHEQQSDPHLHYTVATPDSVGRFPAKPLQINNLAA
jgi:hypothetical protein